ncbi:MAG TPA: M23 family metallopeptidase [Pyrinomonadaceae bacterium]
MTKKTFLCSPTPNGLPSRSSLFRFGLLQRPRLIFSFAFILLCLVLSISSASAQTRAKRASVKPEERLRRVEDRGLSDVDESGRVDNKRQMERPSLVRKTALTYSPRTGNERVERPTLTNDFVIISEASEASPTRRLNAPKASTASANIPSIWPVAGTLRSGVGMRSNPFGGSSVEFHKGQDISAPTGTPVYATADGVVDVARWVKGYGNGIYIDHGNGISTRYGHLSRIDVVAGQTVKRGEQLGLVGSTGRSTGPHLHYEVRINGQPANPMSYLPPVVAPPAAQ